MMKSVIKPIKDESTCMCCLKEDALNKFVRINIDQLGYGSKFDTLSTKLILCPECYKKTDPLWWEFNKVSKIVECGSVDVYEYEDEIINFVEGFPLNGQERFYNSLSSQQRVSQEYWIDLQLFGEENDVRKREDSCEEDEYYTMSWGTKDDLFKINKVLCQALTELFVPRELKVENFKVFYDYEEQTYYLPTSMGAVVIRDLDSISKLIKES